MKLIIIVFKEYGIATIQNMNNIEQNKIIQQFINSGEFVAKYEVKIEEHDLCRVQHN